jgi:Sigma-70 region 2
VTDSLLGRSTSVNEAVAERMPTVAASDVETFASLYQRTFHRAYAYVASLVRDRATAEDVTAQAFERAYRKRRRYRPRRGSPEILARGSCSSSHSHCARTCPFPTSHSRSASSSLRLALPLGVIGAAAWLASAWLRRRRRESALA